MKVVLNVIFGIRVDKKDKNNRTKPVILSDELITFSITSCLSTLLSVSFLESMVK